MKREQCRGPEADGDFADAAWSQKQRCESAQETVSRGQVRRPLAWPAQDNPLLLEHEILRDHGTHAAGPTEPCGRDGQVKQGEEDSFHTRHSRSRDRRNATLPSPRFQRENWEFETHRLQVSRST